MGVCVCVCFEELSKKKQVKQFQTAVQNTMVFVRVF